MKDERLNGLWIESKNGSVEASQSGNSLEEYYLVWREYDKILMSFAKACGLTPIEFGVMTAVADGFVIQSEICELLLMRKQSVNSATKSLSSKGFVVLEAQEKNLRTKTIMLTDEGKKFVAENIKLMEYAEENVWKAMTSSEREAIIELSRKYNRLLASELKDFFEKRGI